MQLPFTTKEFFDVFERYNTDMPYAGLILSAVACVAFVLAFTSFRRASFLILAFLWFWTGAVYHFGYFADVNSLAPVFGALFVFQSFLFVFFSLRSGIQEFGFSGHLREYAGAFLIVFSILVYAFLGWLVGHEFPRSPTFGLPCPLTIFTFGSLLFIRQRIPAYLTVIPLAWSLVGTSAALLFGVWQDTTLLLSAIIFVSVTLWNPRIA